jgi:MFS transporter, DHA2 family, multidrug resistance protein
MAEEGAGAGPAAGAGAAAGAAPARAGLVLISLILVESVANLNLAVANIALPDIGRAFDSGQAAIDLIAVGFSLGLACSVLYLGGLGDRYGRKMMLILGVVGSRVPVVRLRADRRVPVLSAPAPADHALLVPPVPKPQPLVLS